MNKEKQTRKQLLEEHPDQPGVPAYAVVRQSLKGPTYGVGLTVQEAVDEAMFIIRATEAGFEELTVIPITLASYRQVIHGYANDWKAL